MRQVCGLPGPHASAPRLRPRSAVGAPPRRSLRLLLRHGAGRRCADGRVPGVGSMHRPSVRRPVPRPEVPQRADRPWRLQRQCRRHRTRAPWICRPMPGKVLSTHSAARHGGSQIGSGRCARKGLRGAAVVRCEDSVVQAARAGVRRRRPSCARAPGRRRVAAAPARRVRVRTHQPTCQYVCVCVYVGAHALARTWTLALAARTPLRTWPLPAPRLQHGRRGHDSECI